MKGPEVLERVESTIRKLRMFSHGASVGVAVSGGRDSVCLLDLLCELAPKWDLRLMVLHVNHHLRPEADDEEAFVRELACRRGLDILVDRPTLAEGNLEQSAREARLRFFEVAPCDHVATGHTLSDQAETVLFRMLRGTGTTGLAAIRPVTGKLVRPLIECSRAEVDVWVAARELAYREDSSNSEARFARNRIRHELLPKLAREWNPRIEEALAGLAAVSGEEDDYLDRQLPTLAPEPDGSIVIEIEVLAGLHPALARRLVRRVIQAVKSDCGQIEFGHVERVLSFQPGHDRAILPGVDVIRSFDWIRFAPISRAADKGRDWLCPAKVGGEVEIPGGNLISISVDEYMCRYNESVSRVVLDSNDKSLILRNWHPGDKVRLANREEAVKIKQLFQESRIPLWERRNWPVLENASGIVWAGEFGGAVTSGDSTVYVKLCRHGGEYRPMVNQKPESIRLYK